MDSCHEQNESWGSVRFAQWTYVINRVKPEVIYKVKPEGYVNI